MDVVERDVLALAARAAEVLRAGDFSDVRRRVIDSALYDLRAGSGRRFSVLRRFLDEHSSLTAPPVVYEGSRPVLYREDEGSLTDPCVYCGCRHSHGLSDGHRDSHCSFKRLGDVGYVLRSRVRPPIFDALDKMPRTLRTSEYGDPLLYLAECCRVGGESRLSLLYVGYLKWCRGRCEFSKGSFEVLLRRSGFAVRYGAVAGLSLKEAL